MNGKLVALLLAVLGGTAVWTWQSTRVPAGEGAPVPQVVGPSGAALEGRGAVGGPSDRGSGAGAEGLAEALGGGTGPAREAVGEGAAQSPCIHWSTGVLAMRRSEDGSWHTVNPEDPVASDEIAVQVDFLEHGSLRPADDAFVLSGNGLRRRSTWGWGLFYLSAIPPGVYTLTLEDPRFAPWSVDGLEPGRCVRYEPWGSTTVRLRATDGLRGTPLRDFQLERSRFHGLGRELDSIEWIPMQEVGRPAPDGARTWAVVPRLMRGRVVAPGYVPLEIPLEGLVIGEQHAIEVQLVHTIRIAGRVVGEGGRAEAGARVQLLGPGERSWIDMPGAGYCGTLAPRRPPETRTDADGAFAFAGLTPGAWRVCAFTDPWRARMSEEVDLVPGAERSDLELELASNGSLSGIVLPPPGVFEGFTLLVEPVIGPLVDLRGYPPQGIPIPVGADGTFASGPVPPGPARLSLRMPSFSYQSPGTSQLHTRSGGMVEVGTYEVNPGPPTRVELDLSAHRPARLAVHLAPPQGPGRPARVGLWRDPGAREPVAAAQAGPEGLTWLGAVLPGTYHLGVLLEGLPGRYIFPRPLVIEPGVALDLVRTPPVVRGAVRLIHDATGAPLAHHPVRVTAPSGAKDGVNLETDGRGFLELELFPGTYTLGSLHSSRQERWRWITLPWNSARTTPLELRVTLVGP